MNRKKRSSAIAAGWVAFSLVVLVGIGWGCAENGLILYSLYFGWAFIVLAFQLLEYVADHLGCELLIPALCLLSSVVMLAVNVRAIRQMLRFAMEYYPR